MPVKTKAAEAGKAGLPRIPAQLLKQLIPGPLTPAQFEDIFRNSRRPLSSVPWAPR